MSENDPTRRNLLMSLAALPFLASTRETQAGAASVCFTSALEMARLIRTKQLSAREALAAHMTQIERVNPKVNAIVTLVPELAIAAAAKADDSIRDVGRDVLRQVLPDRRRAKWLRHGDKPPLAIQRSGQ